MWGRITLIVLQLTDTYKCYYSQVYLYISIPTYSVLVTVNLTDTQTDAHIVRIDIKHVTHNLGVELM